MSFSRPILVVVLGSSVETSLLANLTTIGITGANDTLDVSFDLALNAFDSAGGQNFFQFVLRDNADIALLNTTIRRNGSINVATAAGSQLTAAGVIPSSDPVNVRFSLDFANDTLDAFVDSNQFLSGFALGNVDADSFDDFLFNNNQGTSNFGPINPIFTLDNFTLAANNAATVPEPGTVSILGITGAVVLVRRRRAGVVQ